MIGNSFPAIDITNWVINPAILNTNSRISLCNQYYKLLGGSGVFGGNYDIVRTFSNIAPHYKIRIKILFLKIDFWNGQSFNLRIDTVIIKSDTFYPNHDSIIGNICGSSDYEAERYYVFDHLHWTNSLEIRIDTTLDKDSTVHSWGISNFELIVYRCNPKCLTCYSENPDKCKTCIKTAEAVGMTYICETR